MGLEEIRRLKMQADEPKPKKQYVIPKVSKKKLEKLARQHEFDKSEEGLSLEQWFDDRRKQMSGVCKHCGGKSCKNDDKYFKFSIAHILPKRIFKSVATHPLNWIELCFWDNSCHTNFDNNTLDMISLNCYDEVIEKFISMYPEIDKSERKYIPDVLMQYINIDL